MCAVCGKKLAKKQRQYCSRHCAGVASSNSPESKLAQWFIREILGRNWTKADWHGSHKSHASKLLKMYSLEDIRGCIQTLCKDPERFGYPGFKLQYMVTILKGEPPYIEQFIAVPDPPPVFEIHNYDDWVLRHGAKAIAQGKWNGIYTPIDEPHRFNYTAIMLMFGEEYADRSRKGKK